MPPSQVFKNFNKLLTNQFFIGGISISFGFWLNYYLSSSSELLYGLNAKKENHIIEPWDEILEFWFNGNTNAIYKKKWFPMGSDQDDMDKEITNKYQEVLNKAMKNELDSWKKFKRGKLALIIILDQFSRHIFRYNKEPKSSDNRILADKLALEIAESITYQNNWQNNENYTFTLYEIIFIMMPYRHTPNVTRLEHVLSIVDSWEKQDEVANNILKKFKNRSIRSLQHLQDRSIASADGDILEFHYRDTDETDIIKSSLVASMKSFFQQFDKHIDIAIVSLSGGVDSMVIAKILTTLRDKCKVFEGLKVIGLHIDYSNREESKKESDFVQWWCEHHNIEFRKRVINEATRGVTARDEYEKITRSIRYGFYKEVLESLDLMHSEVGAILFGHHQGDLQENVLSNIMRGRSPLELSGMRPIGRVEQVQIWRPLLSHRKDDIYDFSHRYGVPYLKDTTPSWSTRGKTRNQLIPLLVDMYGTGFTRNLSSLATASDETKEILDELVYRPFETSVQRYKCGLLVNILQFASMGEGFWKIALMSLMHSMSMPKVKDAGVANFVGRLLRLNSNSGINIDSLKNSLKSKSTNKHIIGNAKEGRTLAGWIELRKDALVRLSDSGDLIIFNNRFITVPTRKKFEFNDGILVKLKELFNQPLKSSVVHHLDNIKVDTNLDTFIKNDFRKNKNESSIGWKVEIILENRIEKSSINQQYAHELDDLLLNCLEGRFEYHLICPTDCVGLRRYLVGHERCNQGYNPKIFKSLMCQFSPSLGSKWIDAKLCQAVPFLIQAFDAPGFTTDDDDIDKKILVLKIIYKKDL